MRRIRWTALTDYLAPAKKRKRTGCRNGSRMGVRNPDQLAQFLQTMQTWAAGNTLGDVTQLGTPEATAAGQ